MEAGSCKCRCLDHTQAMRCCGAKLVSHGAHLSKDLSPPRPGVIRRSFRSVEMFLSSLLLLFDCRAALLLERARPPTGALPAGCMLLAPLRTSNPIRSPSAAGHN